MSYILDALKKSEQARGLRKTLGLLEAPVSPPSLKSVARWPYLIAFVLILNAGFFAFWLRPWQWGGNAGWNRNSISGGQSPEAGRQADPAGPPARPVKTDDRLETSENRPEEKEKSALNPPAAHGAQAVSSVAEREKEGEQGKTEARTDCRCCRRRKNGCFGGTWTGRPARIMWGKIKFMAQRPGRESEAGKNPQQRPGPIRNN